MVRNKICNESRGNQRDSEHIRDRPCPALPQVQEGRQRGERGQCAARWNNHRSRAHCHARDQWPPESALLEAGKCRPCANHGEQCREPVMADFRPETLGHHCPANHEKPGEWRVP